MISDKKTILSKKDQIDSSSVIFLNFNSNEREEHLLKLIRQSFLRIRTSHQISGVKEPTLPMELLSVDGVQVKSEFISWYKFSDYFIPCVTIGESQITTSNLTELLELCNPGLTVIPVALGLCYSFESFRFSDGVDQPASNLNLVDAMCSGLSKGPIDAIVLIYHRLFAIMSRKREGCFEPDQDRSFSYLGVIVGFAVIFDVLWRWGDTLNSFMSFEDFCNSSLHPISILITDFKMPVEAVNFICIAIFAYKSAIISHDDSVFELVVSKPKNFNFDAFRGTEYVIEPFNSESTITKSSNLKHQELEKANSSKDSIIQSSVRLTDGQNNGGNGNSNNNDNNNDGYDNHNRRGRARGRGFGRGGRAGNGNNNSYQSRGNKGKNFSHNYAY